jgi:hypothetical protein
VFQQCFGSSKIGYHGGGDNLHAPEGVSIFYPWDECDQGEVHRFRALFEQDDQGGLDAVNIVGEVTSSRIQSLIISFTLLAPIEPVDIVDASTDNILGDTWQCQQSLTSGHVDIMDAHGGTRVGRGRWSTPTFPPPGCARPVG